MDMAKKWFWIALDALIVVLIVNVLFFVMPMFQKIGNGYAPARVIMVSAQGKTTASPDMAELSFSVVTQGQNPATLSTNNNDKMNAILTFVKSQGIADADIKTVSYDLSPNYQWDKNTQRNYITGYTLTQTVQAKIRDLSKVASVIGGLAPLGANQIGGVSFTFADEEQVLAAARADAFAKVAEKAGQMASGAGVTLGRIVNVSESNYIPMYNPVYAKESVLGMGGVAAPSVPTIQPGTQDITDNVTITYEIQ